MIDLTILARIGAVQKPKNVNKKSERLPLGLPEVAVLCYNVIMNKQNNTEVNYTPIQLKLPVDLEKIIKISDPVYTFNEVMNHIDLSQYLVYKENKIGRPKYDRETLMKIVLFAFMEHGYPSLRQIEKFCDTDIRFIWLLGDKNPPCFNTIKNFINDDLGSKVDSHGNINKSAVISEIFDKINEYIFQSEGVDLNHIYMDGTKIRANAGLYTWVWKKSCIKNRNKSFVKVTETLEKINEIVILYKQAKFETMQEYEITYLTYVLQEFLSCTGENTENFVHGSGKRKSEVQKLYETLFQLQTKLIKYSDCIKTCGDHRNSYSKTDNDATFMRVKKDYMGNDQLSPCYNLQMVACDQYIAHYDVFPFASDMSCFQPLMKGFFTRYGFYPEYPVADAGYGSYNNYLFCEEKGMKKYMKFTMFEKETKNKKYKNNPYRACNFEIDEDGDMICPNGEKFKFLRSSPVKGNEYGRTEEFYQCENCLGCSHREHCHKSKSNRIVKVNEELTQFHQEVIENSNCIHGALLRMNRSIQAEGLFGKIKWNRGYTRFRRKGLNAVLLEVGMISCGFNLHKFHLSKMKLQNVA